MEKLLNHISTLAIEFAPKLLLAVITLIIGFRVANKLASLTSKILRKRKVDNTVIPFLSNIVSVLLKVVVLISVAGIFGVQTTSFIAILASAGLAIGLALQGSLGHFASGVLLLTFRPYKVGDLVVIGGFTGEVEEIQVFNTVLRTLDNKKIIIPNGSVTTGPITNISGQGTIRVDMQYSVSGAEDIDKVTKVIKSVSDACPFLLKNKPTDILVNSQEIGITIFDVRPWCSSEQYWNTYYFMQENIKRSFVSEGIIAPKPAMEVSLIK
jgi:small conductance mechanosensitive channel